MRFLRELTLREFDCIRKRWCKCDVGEKILTPSTINHLKTSVNWTIRLMSKQSRKNLKLKMGPSCTTSAPYIITAPEDDNRRSSAKRAMYWRFSSSQISMNLAIMYDMLAEILMLSDNLQSRNMIAECERVFSQTKFIMSPTRTRLTTSDVSSLCETPRFHTVRLQYLAICHKLVKRTSVC
ncbi:hypothetical protein PR048_004911 [Dryococelus australis]|uniref:Uncharacterized protein n=1 Tax=Dryococelus australis TaxID=614101 RepID=A0ABQ9I6S1_9NEOP|nr:hypothetical protein PR048_004911 [Dryococelus australis]